MSAQFTSNLEAWRRRHNRAVDAALIATSLVLVAAEKRGLRGGYTSGDFVTGRSVNAVTRSEVTTEDGVRVIRVGTNLLYNLFWELGHINRFTRKYERVEKWKPTALDAVPAMREKFIEIYNAMMRAA